VKAETSHVLTYDLGMGSIEFFVSTRDNPAVVLQKFSQIVAPP
jgi:hypothetical protein